MVGDKLAIAHAPGKILILDVLNYINYEHSEEVSFLVSSQKYKLANKNGFKS